MSYVHNIGGAIGATQHAPGDPVDPNTPDRKLEEWLAAGIITPAPPKRGRKVVHDDNDDD